jgi:hypothetical protein
MLKAVENETFKKQTRAGTFSPPVPLKLGVVLT